MQFHAMRTRVTAAKTRTEFKKFELNILLTNNTNPPNAIFPWFPFEVFQSKKAKCESNKSSSKMSRVADLSQTLIHVFKAHKVFNPSRGTRKYPSLFAWLLTALFEF